LDFEKGTLFFKKGKKRLPGETKIEDKLIQFGENVKKKRAEQKIQKLKVFKLRNRMKNQTWFSNLKLTLLI
jgi:hypothetical protein